MYKTFDQGITDYTEIQQIFSRMFALAKKLMSCLPLHKLK